MAFFYLDDSLLGVVCCSKDVKSKRNSDRTQKKTEGPPSGCRPVEKVLKVLHLSYRKKWFSKGLPKRSHRKSVVLDSDALGCIDLVSSQNTSLEKDASWP
jgi:hypothetical protein